MCQACREGPECLRDAHPRAHLGISPTQATRRHKTDPGAGRPRYMAERDTTARFVECRPWAVWTPLSVRRRLVLGSDLLNRLLRHAQSVCPEVQRQPPRLWRSRPQAPAQLRR
jgi:hypothetical protein